MTKSKTLYPRDDIDRLYVRRKHGETKRTNINGIIDASKQRKTNYTD